MTRRRIVGAILILGLLGASAWWVLGGRTTAADGELVVVWTGSHEGTARLPGTVAWCPVTRTATLEAISANTGLMISLLAADSLAAGVHPTYDPALRNQAPRPGSVAGLRWVDDTVAIRGFQSIGGLVHLREVGQAVSGEADFRMRAAAGADTLLVRATFRRLPVLASAVGCP